ncbi:hypothetical protein KPH14_011858 [Odynerus spinipes]|uniref:Cc8K15.2-like protein n=1 Tax=Odynerus spinipes TaxID=1348599 RepID=A0AAD9REN5_9HYME|nr:hypothetical protein KPH14_011858 [Odynerus spinipes]
MDEKNVAQAEETSSAIEAPPTRYSSAIEALLKRRLSYSGPTGNRDRHRSRESSQRSRSYERYSSGDRRNSSSDYGSNIGQQQPLDHETELNVDILQVFEDRLVVLIKKRVLAPAIHKDIAVRWEEIVKKSLPAEERKALLKKYSPRINCTFINPPRLNLEVKATVNSIISKRDDRVSEKQEKIGAALAGIGKALTFILKSDCDGKIAQLESLNNAARLLTDLQRDETEIRRSLILKNIKASFRDTLKDTTPDECQIEVQKTSVLALQGGERRRAETESDPQVIHPLLQHAPEAGPGERNEKEQINVSIPAGRLSFFKHQWEQLTADKTILSWVLGYKIPFTTRKSSAEAIKTDFQNNVPDVVTVHWDGKLLPGLNVRSSKEERLTIIASFDDREQLLAVPKLGSSSGKHQAKAASIALYDWNLNDKVQIMCCDTSSNTGRFNGACALLEQTLGRELLLFACRHHVYELVLKTVFETKIKQITSSPDIPIFKKFRDNWKNIDSNDIELCLDFVKEHVTETNITSLLMFYKAELDKAFIRDDYRELVELCVVFLGGDSEKKIQIKPPGPMHQAR